MYSFREGGTDEREAGMLQNRGKEKRTDMAKTAKYQQVIDWIKNRIENGELRDGDRLETEQEIGEKFGISRQTVRHGLSLLEKEELLEKIQGSGSYVRTWRQREGAPQLSHTVSIISSYVDSYIFPRILQSMVKALERAGYSSRIMFTGNHLETERNLLNRMLEENSQDPLIVEPVMSGLPNPNLDDYRKLQKKGIPILFFNSFYPELELPHVSMNDKAAGRLATEYLIERGHTRIGGIFKSDDGQGRCRYRGYLDAMQKRGLPITEKRIRWIDTMELNWLEQNGSQLLERLSDCTACVCYNDQVAHALTEVCTREGIRIPEELSLVSIDNSELSRLNAVELTSVAHPMEALGKRAAENLLHLVMNPRYEATYEFVPEIVERKSVADLRH